MIAYQSAIQKRRRRLYFYLTSGLKWNVGERVSFYTMTTAPEALQSVTASWADLVLDARRMSPRKMIEGGYVSVRKAAYVYELNDVDDNFKFEYAGCVTDEGNGVIHALVAGEFLPVSWVRERWLYHHKTPQFKIKLVKAGDNKRLVKYILEQYIAQQDSLVRLIVSQNWLYRGCRADWLAMLKEYKTDFGDVTGYLRAREEWDNLMWKNNTASPLIDSLRNERLIKIYRRIHREKLNGSKHPNYYVKERNLGGLCS